MKLADRFRKHSGLSAVMLLAAISIVAGCNRAQPPEGRFNVILISIDTLRADRLGVYGYERDTSPNIDTWARSSLIFDNAVAESSWTLPSHVTMLSGLLPGNHATVRPTLRPGDSVVLLPEIFADAHYRTIGLTDAGYMVSEHGFDRGFDVFDSKNKTFDATARRAMEEISRLQDHERFFLFLHTYDVHCPYDPSEPFRQMFVSADAEFIDTEGRCGNPDFNSLPLTAGQIQYLSDSYDASIRELDEQFAHFIEQLRSQGLLENTVVILTSDHGEEFGEHGQIGHERTLFRESLMVPLIVASPQLAPGRSHSLVGLVDVAPTALSLAGVEFAVPFDGNSLNDRANEGATGGSLSRFSELSWQGKLRSIMTPEWHLILDLEDRQSLLFSRSNDSPESLDLADDEPEIVDRLMEDLRYYQAQLEPRPAEPIGPQDSEQIEQLRALGYIN